MQRQLANRTAKSLFVVPLSKSLQSTPSLSRWSSSPFPPRPRTCINTINPAKRNFSVASPRSAFQPEVGMSYVIKLKDGRTRDEYRAAMRVLTKLVHIWERENVKTGKATKVLYDEYREKGVFDEVIELFKQRTQKAAEIDAAQDTKVDEQAVARLQSALRDIDEDVLDYLDHGIYSIDPSFSPKRMYKAQLLESQPSPLLLCDLATAWIYLEAPIAARTFLRRINQYETIFEHSCPMLKKGMGVADLARADEETVQYDKDPR